MAARPPAKEVGDEFAKKYYHVSQNLPDELHRFYTDASKIGRLIGQDGLMRLSTLSDIDDNLNVLSSAGGFDSAEVTSITSQDSQGGGVVVNIGGYFTLKGTLERRNFTQAFFLSPQEEPKGYIVLNDILRFDDQPLLPVIETEINRSQIAQRVSEPNDDGLEDVSKISDASVAIQDDRFSGEDSVNNGALTEEGSTVHVRSLPPGGRSITTIRDAFKKFGPVFNRGIRIKTRSWDKYYAFVRFKEANAAERAIKASPVLIAGEKVDVEKARGQGYWDEARLLRGGTSEHLGGTGDLYDFWDWPKSMEEQSMLQGDHRVGDYSQSQVMEEHSKFLEELQRKQDEENQN